MRLDDNRKAFIALVKAGLWEQEVKLSSFDDIDFSEIDQLAQEQSVVGLVAAGIERVTDIKAPQQEVLNIVGSTLQLEQRNRILNEFVVWLTERLREEKVSALLVKGQGVAQCYERPLWRAAGDIDLLLDTENYENAKKVLFPIADDVSEENTLTEHQGLNIRGVEIELHGKMPFLLSKRADCVIDEVISNSLKSDGVCIWKDNNRDVFLPNPDNHVFLIFTHFLHHFFVEGVGLRQICDWCRLIWKNKENINITLLEKRLKEAGLMTEWRTFAALAVNTLGMPVDAMPFYKEGYTRKANLALSHIMKSGNFGHNHDVSYRGRHTGFVSKLITFSRRLKDFIKFSFIFLIDSPKFFVTYVAARMKGTAD